MSPLTQPALDTCFDCGREVSDARQVTACLWKSPVDGREHWGEVPICPQCAGERGRQQRLWLSVAVVLVALLTAAAAYPLLP